MLLFGSKSYLLLCIFRIDTDKRFFVASRLIAYNSENAIFKKQIINQYIQ